MDWEVEGELSDAAIDALADLLLAEIEKEGALGCGPFPAGLILSGRPAGVFGENDVDIRDNENGESRETGRVGT